jgi:hypothetical protein
MGMESFFVIILPKGVFHKKSKNGSNIYEGNSGIGHDEVKNILMNIPNISVEKYSNNDIAIMKKYLLKQFYDNNKLLFIEIESCLYYLSTNDSILFDMISYFIKLGFNVFHPGIGSVNDLKCFMEKLKIFYKEKMELFIKKYGYLFKSNNILPGNEFFKNIKPKFFGIL